MRKPHESVSVLELPYATVRGDNYGETIPQATMAPTQLRSILHRLHIDFYSQDEVLDRIAARVAQDLR